MRSRPLVAAFAALALALSTAACGGDDEEAVVEPTSGQIVPPSQPVTAVESTPDATPADSADGDSGSGGDEKSAGEKAAERKPSSDLLPSVASKSTDLTNFTTALGAAGLTDTLAGNGPYTVFAPNNDGFAKLGTRLDTLLQPASKAELVNILSFHVIKGEYRAKDLEDGTLLTTLQGTRLRVSKKGDTVTVGNSLGKATVVSTDLIAGNGVIHVIDTVMSPKTK